MRNGQHGFTLVELLIAVLLLVLVTAMLFDGLRLVTHHLGRESGRLDRSSQIALVENFLRTQLADAQPFSTGAGATSSVDFDGQSDRLVFISPAPSSVVFGGLQVLSIGFVGSSGGGELRAAWRPYRDDSGGAPAGAARPLLSDVRQAVFAYFGSIGPNAAPDWHEEWRDMSGLPLLVRLSVVFSDGQTMPELIIALRLASGVAARSSSGD